MAEREPALLRDEPAEGPAAPAPSEPPRSTRKSSPRVERPVEPTRKAGEGPTVHVAGFWRRLVAGFIDLGVILPVAALLTWIASTVANVHLPASRTRGLDFWLDLLLASDPALVTAAGMLVAVAAVYLMVFQFVMGQTLGMRLLKMRVIDVWGERPSIARCAARTGGYLVSVATVMLGFLWVGFDAEKRGLHDWIAGTYVIKA
jgi:uncharacterized RDD family membrane protein YckC